MEETPTTARRFTPSRMIGCLLLVIGGGTALYALVLVPCDQWWAGSHWAWDVQRTMPFLDEIQDAARGDTDGDGKLEYCSLPDLVRQDRQGFGYFDRAAMRWWKLTSGETVLEVPGFYLVVYFPEPRSGETEADARERGFVCYAWPTEQPRRAEHDLVFMVSSRGDAGWSGHRHSRNDGAPVIYRGLDRPPPPGAAFPAVPGKDWSELEPATGPEPARDGRLWFEGVR